MNADQYGYLATEVLATDTAWDATLHVLGVTDNGILAPLSLLILRLLVHHHRVCSCERSLEDGRREPAWH
jgi:hypothetical protein